MCSYSFTVFMSAYPIFVAHLMPHVPDHRRGATFGALALLSIPYFLYMEKRQWTTSALAPPA